MDKKMPKLDFNKKEEKQSVEITIQIRDKKGNPTGKTKSFDGESWRSASDWYEKQKPRKKKKRRRNKKDANK